MIMLHYIPPKVDVQLLLESRHLLIVTFVKVQIIAAFVIRNP